MTESTKYFRTVVEVEVITINEPLDDSTQLDDIHRLVIHGAGRINRWQVWEIEYDLAAALLRQQDSLPDLIIGPDPKALMNVPSFPLTITADDLDATEAFNLQIYAADNDEVEFDLPLWREKSGLATTVFNGQVFDLTNGVTLT